MSSLYTTSAVATGDGRNGHVQTFDGHIDNTRRVMEEPWPLAEDFSTGPEASWGPREVLAHVAREEARHYTFYRTVFKEVLARDPNAALESAARIMPAIDMPGVKMPNFRELSDVVRRAGHQPDVSV